MPRPTAAELERIEIEAFADAAAGAGSTEPARRASFRRFGTAAAFFLAGSSSPMLNRIVGLGVESVATPEQLDAILDHANETVRRFSISLTPEAQPSRLWETLVARGLEPGYPWMKFHRAADASPPAVDTPYAIRRVATPREADAFAQLVSEVMMPEAGPIVAGAVRPGRPGWACFVAWDRERPVGAGAVFVRGGLGWLGFGVTHPDHRRRGVQRALLRARILTARELGARSLSVDTGVRRPGLPDASYRNLEWAGFEEAYVRQHLTSPLTPFRGARL